MKECWIITDCLHSEVIKVCETKRDARDEALKFFKEIAEYNNWEEEEITGWSNELYNSSSLYDDFGIDDIVYCEKAKFLPDTLAH